MDAARIVRRIGNNLDWHRSFGPPGPGATGDVWRHIEAAWSAPDRAFVALLYPLLLGRAADARSMESLLASLAKGARRSAVVRRLALSREARRRRLDVTWLPCLTALDRFDVWPHLRALWRVRDRAFVEGLYRVLLGRRADRAGLDAFHAALSVGLPRSELVRRIALCDEARTIGLNVSWLTRVAELETPRRSPLSSLRSALRRWMTGWKGAHPAVPSRRG